VRFYLDEDLSDEVARIARAQGLDVISSHECGRDGSSDDAQLRFAAEDGRCMVTRNRDDFIQWTVRFYENGWPHVGVLIVTHTLQHRTAAVIAAALLAYAEHHEDDLPDYAIDFLSPAP